MIYKNAKVSGLVKVWWYLHSSWFS